MALKLYLDNCCYNRPFDNQTQLKVFLETQAKLQIQAAIKEGVYQLVWSYVLDYESAMNPYDDRRNAIERWREASEIIVVSQNEHIDAYAEKMVALGIKQFDALHLACAVEAGADFFITTDRGILKKAIQEEIKVVSPLPFIDGQEV